MLFFGGNQLAYGRLAGPAPTISSPSKYLPSNIVFTGRIDIVTTVGVVAGCWVGVEVGFDDEKLNTRMLFSLLFLLESTPPCQKICPN